MLVYSTGDHHLLPSILTLPGRNESLARCPHLLPCRPLRGPVPPSACSRTCSACGRSRCPRLHDRCGRTIEFLCSIGRAGECRRCLGLVFPYWFGPPLVSIARNGPSTYRKYSWVR